MRIHRSLRTFWSYVALVAVLTAGCADDTPVTPGEPIPDEGAYVQYLNPRANEARVDLDDEIRIILSRPLVDAEVEPLVASVNGRSATIRHQRYELVSYVYIDPPDPLNYHTVYLVDVRSTTGGTLSRVRWRFATGPGPAGLLWERADAPVTEDLLSVGEVWNGYTAVGRGGVIVHSHWSFDWGDDVFGIGERGGPPQSEDIVWIWPGNNNRSAAVTGDGQVWMGPGIGSYMWKWEDQPADLHVNGMFGITSAMVGELRSQPGTGFVSSSYPYPGVTTTTGAGRVMRDVTSAWRDGSFYIAVGDNGSIFVSPDAQSWEDVNFAPSWGDLETVMGLYQAGDPETSQAPWIGVAAGESIAWSENGRDWRWSYSPPTGRIHGLAWNGYPLDERMYLAAGDNGLLLQSSDGKFWESVDYGLDIGGADLYGVLARYSRWVVVGEGGITLISPPNAIKF